MRAEETRFSLLFGELRVLRVGLPRTVCGKAVLGSSGARAHAGCCKDSTDGLKDPKSARQTPCT